MWPLEFFGVLDKYAEGEVKAWNAGINPGIPSESFGWKTRETEGPRAFLY